MQKKYAISDDELATFVRIAQRDLVTSARRYANLRKDLTSVSDEDVTQRLEIAEHPSKAFPDPEAFSKAVRENPIPMFCAMFEVAERQARMAVEDLRIGKAIGRNMSDLLFLVTRCSIFIGFLHSRLTLQEATKNEERVLDDLLKTYGAKGGAARADKYEPLKREAIRLAGLASYRSANHAAARISAKILAMPEANNVGLSKDRAEKTIANWLKKEGVKFGTDAENDHPA